MGDRDRYGHGRRPRSPTFNPARASLPINLAGPFTSTFSHPHPASHEHHTHVVPTRRELIPVAHSRSASTASNAGTVTTTYKIKADPPARSSSHRDGSRARSSTVDSHNRPAGLNTVQTRHKPVVHSGRPASPMKNPYRSSEEEYYAVPASSKHSHSHRKRYSATMDNADMNRLARERDSSRLRTGSGRESATYTGTRPRSVFPSSAVRHADTVADDYGDDGYGYTNPRDLVQYDLNNNSNSTRHRSRRDSFDSGGRSRPSSIGGYADLVPRSYDTRERGPPPSKRGFDRIPRGATWEQPLVRMPVAPPPPMEPIQRPARIEMPFEEQPVRHNSARRPVSMYHDRERERKNSKDDFYEVRDDDPRDRRERAYRNDPQRFDNPVEQRGFGIRAEVPPPPRAADIPPPRPERPDAYRPERSERVDRSDRLDRSDRVDRSDRLEMPERRERVERSDRLDDDRGDRRSGRDALAAGLSLAGAAIGLKAVKKSKDDRDEREEKEDRRQRDFEYDDEPHRRREPREDRDHKERRHRDDDRDRDIPLPRESAPPAPPKERVPSPRGIPPPPRDASSRDKDTREHLAPEADFIDLGRGKDRPSSRNERPERPASRIERPSSRIEKPISRNEKEGDSDRRERHRRRDEASAVATDSRSDSSSSDPVSTRRRRESRSEREPVTSRLPVKEATTAAAFNPKDTMDLKALKEALNAKENATPKEIAPPKEAHVSRTPRASTTKDVAEVAQIRSDLKDERKSREPLAASENQQQVRVVSPPRTKQEEKPVKGILRAPREKFPEDPSPIREGVAPLKDAKKDGVPPDARWTKISRKLVNPEALELGKERYEARDDFVIVLRVLSRDEVQGYAEVTQKLRATREEQAEYEAREERRRARRERHERHKRERSRGERTERSERRRRRERDTRDSESDTTEDDEPERDVPKLLEPAPPRRRAASNNFEDMMMSGGLASSNLREDPNSPGQYLGYTRNPPPSGSLVTMTSGSSKRDR
ncbi:putative major royal jelly protein 5 [Halenospora varia]|nr:putative major royal jelly protein 5 [Halenospora varia]